MTRRPHLPRDDQDRIIWGWICPICHTEWTSGDGRCPRYDHHGHRYDPDTCRCICGALDHPEWGVTA